MDYSLIGGVTTGTTIQYFIVAQDVFATPLVGINSVLLLSASRFNNSCYWRYINSFIIQELSTSTTGGTIGLTTVGGLFADLNTKDYQQILQPILSVTLQSQEQIA
jgi:hypothetical protein